MENNLNLEKEEKRSLKKSRKRFSLSVFGASSHTDWMCILGSALFLLVLVSAGVFLKYRSVLAEVKRNPESVTIIEEGLDYGEVEKLIEKYEARAGVLNNLR